MNRILPEGSVIGAWDAGTVGYFSDFPVVNLDGLANDHDYRKAQMAAGVDESDRGARRHWMLEPGADGLASHADRFGITHFVDYAGHTRRVSSEFEYEVLFESPASVVRIGPISFRLWTPRRETVRASGRLPERPGESGGADWFWRRIEPHFEWREEGVGLTVDGRIVQVFARDCAPEDSAVVFWTDRDGADGSAAAPMAKNPNGSCVAAVLLPHGAGKPRHATITSVEVE